MTTATTAEKPHVDDQCCGNCASMRRRPTVSGRSADLECRWDGPPWTDKGVVAGDWCRRWAPKPPPKKVAEVVKEPDHG